MPKLRRLGMAFSAAAPILGGFREQLLTRDTEREKNAVQMLINQMQEEGATGRTRMTQAGEDGRAAASRSQADMQWRATHPGELDRLSENAGPDGATPFGPKASLTPFLPSVSERSAPFFKQNREADSPTKLTEADLAGDPSFSRLPANIQQGILASRASKLGGLRQAASETAATTTDVVADDGTKSRTLPTGQVLRTGLNATQTGRNNAATFLAGEGSPAVQQNRISFAAREAGATTSARLGVELNDVNTAKRVAQATQIAKAEALAKRDVEGAVEQEKAAQTLVTALAPITQIEQLYNAVVPGGTYTAAKRSLQDRVGYLGWSEPQAAALNNFGKTYAMQLYRSIGGATTTQGTSNQDIDNIMAGIPNASTPEPVAREMIRRMRASAILVPYSLKLKGMSPSDRLKVMDRWSRMLTAEPTDPIATAADTLYDPETGIELPNLWKQ